MTFAAVQRGWLGRWGRHAPPLLPRWRAHHPNNLCVPTSATDSTRGHCWSCHRDSPGTRLYRVCFECNHGYRTRLHLLVFHLWRDWQTRGYGDRWWPFHLVRPSRIYSCPCCSHDF